MKHYGHSVSQSVLSEKYSQLYYLQPEVSPSSLLVAFLTWPSCPNSYLPVYLPQLATHSFPLFIFVALQSGQPGLYTETAVHKNLLFISIYRPSHSIFALDQVVQQRDIRRGSYTINALCVIGLRPTNRSFADKNVRGSEHQNVGDIKIYLDLIKITFEIKISKKVINNSDCN